MVHEQVHEQIEEEKVIDELDDEAIDALMADAHDQSDEEEEERARTEQSFRFSCPPKIASRSLFPLAKRAGSKVYF